VEERLSVAGAGLADTRAAAEADDAFGADLYRMLAAGGGNTVFSPASIAAALRMALCGARGETAAEMAAVLRLSGPDAAGEGLRLLSGAVAGAIGGRDLIFRAPNTMWVQSGLPLQPGFTAQLRDAAAVTVRDADFISAPDAAREEINRVIAGQTAGKITGLLEQDAIDPLTRLVLANAVYLKAAWAHPFPMNATGDAPFYPDGDGGGAAVTVRMMHLSADLRYLRGDGYQAVLLPYAGCPLAMAVVLPDGPLAALAARLTSGGLRGLLHGTALHRVTLALPRFRQEAKFELVPALKGLGMVRAFDPGAADFSGITTAEPLHIGVVVHKAYIDADEKGTEAAAATAVGIRTISYVYVPGPVTMVVERPFCFAILDTATGLPLFLGQVSRPSTP
jgi:serpin B